VPPRKKKARTHLAMDDEYFFDVNDGTIRQEPKPQEPTPAQPVPSPAPLPDWLQISVPGQYPPPQQWTLPNPAAWIAAYGPPVVQAPAHTWD
jgi:hypothetical protein